MKKMSADVSTSEQIASVGTISAGDPAIGQKISEAMEVVGKDGVITVEDSQTFGIDIDCSSTRATSPRTSPRTTTR